MTQPELFTQRTAGHLTFEEPAPFQRSSATSHVAAQAQTPAHRCNVRERIHSHISLFGAGKTREEIANELGLRLATVCGRTHELIHAGRIFAKGTRPTTSGMPAEVLVVT